ncbi:MAG: hypothetical protein HN341_06255 [Verrucomicrobia bacterium]|jgi:hypothetical protein|nr:hypothetical protein [Verrucomicrobiota bacterium]
MTLAEIAQTITPTGRAAAIIGLILCVVVLAVQFRTRNLARKDEEAADAAVDEAAKDEPPEAVPEPSSKPKSAFKTFTPDEAPPAAGDHTAAE